MTGYLAGDNFAAKAKEPLNFPEKGSTLSCSPLRTIDIPFNRVPSCHAVISDEVDTEAIQLHLQ